jgi:hypothetical protein
MSRSGKVLSHIRGGLDRLDIPLRFRLILLVVAGLVPLLGLGLHEVYRG